VPQHAHDPADVVITDHRGQTRNVVGETRQHERAAKGGEARTPCRGFKAPIDQAGASSRRFLVASFLS
jgi:hypothetical protein